MAASVVDAVAISPNGIKTLLVNAFISHSFNAFISHSFNGTFPINDKPVFKNLPKNLPKNPPDCPVLCN